VATGTVEFKMPGGRTVTFIFIAPTRLDHKDSGILDVDRDFYDEICKVVSASEGRTIDVLSHNRFPPKKGTAPSAKARE
jgi:hypothetical protein